MVEMTLKGGDALMKRLADIATSMGGGSVSVGFMEGAKYDDGQSVAQVAYMNEFGTTTAPARPFFRNMIAKESPNWGDNMARLAKENDYDGKKVFGIMGDDIKGALHQSITEFTDPANAPSTIRKKGFDKPLIDTGHMLNSITIYIEE